MRTYRFKSIRTFLTVAAVCISLWHVYTLFLAVTSPIATLGTHWACGMFLLFMYYPASKKTKYRDRLPWYDMIFLAATLAVIVYIRLDADGLIMRTAYFKPTTADIVFGVIACVVTLESGRRSIGLGLPVVSLCLIAYALWGNILPGSWASKGYSIARLSSYLFSINGLYGTAIKMSCSTIFLLILFGAFVAVSGTGDMLMRLATSAFGGRRGGPAKVAVVGSALFGTFSGSAVANVVGTGMFTIPLMKKAKYRPEFAGAVEAVASTGGQIMPPVMGSGAFIMAELLGLPYATIALAAAIPAIIYYFAVYLAVDLEAAKKQLPLLDVSAMERPSQIFKREWNLLMPLFVLILALGVFKRTIVDAAVWAILSSVVFSYVRRESSFTFKKITEALEMGAKNAITIISACACAGTAIGAIMLTGLGLKFSIMVTQLADNSLFLCLVLSAMAATVLGMGLPTVAAYVIGASVLAGTLTTLGLPALASHFFIFYYALLSQITPPVALAAYAAGNIAKANPMRVGFLSCRIGAMAFLLPFFIAYGPAMILIGTPGEIILAALTAIVGVMLFTYGQFGWLMGEDMKWYSRILLVTGSILLLIPGYVTDLYGAAGTIVALLTHPAFRRKLRTLLAGKK